MHGRHVHRKHATGFNCVVNTAIQSKGAPHGLLMKNAQRVRVSLKQLCSHPTPQVAGYSHLKAKLTISRHCFSLYLMAV
jgi:hypothetical protein